jgi:hypothetical protein
MPRSTWGSAEDLVGVVRAAGSRVKTDRYQSCMYSDTQLVTIS